MEGTRIDPPLAGDARCSIADRRGEGKADTLSRMKLVTVFDSPGENVRLDKISTRPPPTMEKAEARARFEELDEELFGLQDLMWGAAAPRAREGPPRLLEAERAGLEGPREVGRVHRGVRGRHLPLRRSPRALDGRPIRREVVPEPGRRGDPGRRAAALSQGMAENLGGT